MLRSTGNIHLNQPIVGMAATPDGGGYWLVASDGGMFNFGDATFHGSAGSDFVSTPFRTMLASNGSYRLVTTNGFVYGFDAAPSCGTPPGAFTRIVGAASTHR